MEMSLMGVFVVVAFMVPVAVCASSLLFLATDATMGCDVTPNHPYFESPYQPMRMLVARGTAAEVAADVTVEAASDVETREAA